MPETQKLLRVMKKDLDDVDALLARLIAISNTIQNIITAADPMNHTNTKQWLILTDEAYDHMPSDPTATVREKLLAITTAIGVGWPIKVNINSAITKARSDMSEKEDGTAYVHLAFPRVGSEIEITTGETPKVIYPESYESNTWLISVKITMDEVGMAHYLCSLYMVTRAMPFDEIKHLAEQLNGEQITDEDYTALRTNEFDILPYELPIELVRQIAGNYALDMTSAYYQRVPDEVRRTEFDRLIDMMTTDIATKFTCKYLLPRLKRIMRECSRYVIVKMESGSIDKGAFIIGIKTDGIVVNPTDPVEKAIWVLIESPLKFDAYMLKGEIQVE